MDYIEVSLNFDPNDQKREIVIAFMSQLPFESFINTETGIKAFVTTEDFNQKEIERIISGIPEIIINFKHELIKRVNWNEEWEKNFSPIVINKDCIVRAPFHAKPINTAYDIIIMPKMSFGTGHHATTILMLRSMINEPFENKRVLDAGCGTGILSIMAEKLHAKMVLAFDIDDWAVLNSRENFALNNCKNIDVEKGSVENIHADGFDVILANINKNVLIRDIPLFSNKLNEGGLLIISGIYEDDESDIITNAELHKLRKAHIARLDKWALIKLLKLA